MTAVQQVFSCADCGQMIAVVHRGNGRLVCCGRPMIAAGTEQTGAVSKGGVRRDKDLTRVRDRSEQHFWKCSNCNYVLEAAAPPDRCPACAQKCPFVDVTCYIPECGMVGADPRLIGNQ